MNQDPPHIRARLATPVITDAQIEAGTPAQCVHCGCRQSIAQLRSRWPGSISCCPERAMRARPAQDLRLAAG